MEFENIVVSALDTALRSAVDEVIAKYWGYGVDTEIKQVIKDKARELIETSPELQGLIFDALKSWISAQTADEIRKRQAENKNRYGHHTP